MSDLQLARTDLQYWDAWTSHPPVGTSKQELAHRRSCFLQLRGAFGTAFGEATPLPGFGTDSFELASGALRLIDVGALQASVGRVVENWSQDAGGSVTQIDARSPIGSASILHVLEASSASIVSPSAKFCVEMLVLDAASQICRVPVHQMLGSQGGIPLIAASAVIDPLAEGWQQEFARKVAAGVFTFKVKCGRNLAAELAVVRQIVEQGTGSFRVRLDPNGAWSSSDLRSFLAGCSKANIDWVEDPTTELSEWPSLQEETDVPFAIDEPLSMGGVALMERSEAQVVVLKPMALGGYAKAMTLAQAARGRARKVCVSHFFDGPVAMRACIQMAYVLQSRDTAAGLGDHAGLAGYAGLPFPPCSEFQGGTLDCGP